MQLCSTLLILLFSIEEGLNDRDRFSPIFAEKLFRIFGSTWHMLPFFVLQIVWYAWNIERKSALILGLPFQRVFFMLKLYMKKISWVLFTVNGTKSLGWRHYSKFDYVRGCGDKNVSECVQLWVERDKTSNTSITCKWTLPDQDDHTTFMAEQVNFNCIFSHGRSPGSRCKR